MMLFATSICHVEERIADFKSRVMQEHKFYENPSLY